LLISIPIFFRIPGTSLPISISPSESLNVFNAAAIAFDKPGKEGSVTKVDQL